MKKPFPWLNGLLLLVPLCMLLGFDVDKATHTPLTHDEAITFLRFVPQSFMDVISYKDAFTNNHILNTLLIQWSTGIFGDSELAIRLPAILAHGAYIVFSFLFVLRFFSSPVIRIPAFVLLNLNPYLLDFFTLARGYGLAISLMMAALYFFCIHLQKGSMKHWYLTHGLMTLSVLANFALVLVLAAFHLLFQLYLWMRKPSWREWLKWNAVNLAAILITVLFLWEPLRKIAQYHLVDFGGQAGFWADSVNSLVLKSLGTIPWESNWQPALWVIVWLGYLLQFIFWVIAGVRGGPAVFQKHQIALTLNLLLVIPIALHHIQHGYQGTPWVMERFALFLVPLFWLSLLGMMNYFAIENFFSAPGAIATWILAAMMFVLSLTGTPNRYTLNWKNDKDTPRLLEEINKDRQKYGMKNVRLCVTWYYEPVLNYYRVTKSYSWLEPVNRDPAGPDFDYYLMDRFEYKQPPVEIDTIYSQHDWPIAIMINRNKYPAL